MANLTITVEAAPFITGQWFGETGQTNAIARTNPSAVVSVIGPRGAQGPSGAQVTVTAQEALGGHRAITADGFHATASLLDKLAGISTGAASIGENGDIQPGDLIVTSSTPGKGMRQADDVVRSYTVAKAREAVTFTDPSEVKLVACIYLCG